MPKTKKAKTGLHIVSNWIGLSLIFYVVFGGMLSLLGTFIFSKIYTNVHWKNWGSAPEWAIGLYLLLVPTLVLLGTYWLLKRAPKKIQPKLLFGKSNVPMRILTPLFLGVIIIINIISSVLMGFLVKPFMQNFPASGIGIFLYFLYTCMVPAVLEEVVFRGMIQGMLRRWGTWFAIFTTSLLFAFLHNNVNSILQVFLLSLVLCYCREITNSISACIVLHFVNNFITFIIAWAQSGVYDTGVIGLWFLLIAIMLAFFVSGVWAVKQYKLGPTLKMVTFRPENVTVGKDVMGLFSSPLFLVGIILMLANFIVNIFV